MENPKNDVPLRRHSTLHPRLQRHSTLQRRASAVVRNRLNKNNPYVGFIRHAPSASDRLQALFEEKLGASVFHIPISFHQSSPHIELFRHTPSSRGRIKRLEHIEKNIETLVATYSYKLNSSKSKCTHPLIDGKLKGGAPINLRDLNLDFDAIHRSLQNCEAGSPSATIQVLSRLASWFLFPLAHDESSCGYRHEKDPLKPHLNSPERPLYGPESADDDSNDDDNSTDSIQTVGTLLPLDNIEARHIVVSAPFVSNDGLADSVATILSEVFDSTNSSPHYTTQSSNDLFEGGHPSLHSSTHFDYDESELDDFVITQVDIARMARNAARHLDVESIWSLPTTIYRAPTQPPTSEYDDMGDGSWLIIPEAVDTTPRHDAVCVICLEAFCDDNRLRILPCQHAFHMGCIDRWLSGSHSFVDCDTSGCPTCKKKLKSNALDGSVPSWAFIRLGQSLASKGL